MWWIVLDMGGENWKVKKKKNHLREEDLSLCVSKDYIIHFKICLKLDLWICE